MKSLFLMLFATTYYGWCWQNAYNVVGEYARITYFNKSLAENVTCWPYKVNRTTMAFNLAFTLRMDVQSNADMQLKVTGFQFRSTEYRQGPIEFMLPICGMFKARPYDIANFVNCSNLHDCPLPKGTYKVIGFSPNSTNFPPLIPAGKWMLQFNIYYKMTMLVGTMEYMFKIHYINPLFNI